MGMILHARSGVAKRTGSAESPRPLGQGGPASGAQSVRSLFALGTACVAPADLRSSSALAMPPALAEPLLDSG
eukprot:5969186-Alexandrium_andersonii.AAC.1